MSQSLQIVSLRHKVYQIAQVIGQNYPDSKFKTKYVDLLADSILKVVKEEMTDEEIDKYAKACELFLSLDRKKVTRMQKRVNALLLTELEKEFS